MVLYLNLSGAFVSTAGNMDHKRPFIWLHEYSSSLGTGGVVGGRTAAMRALYAAARRLLHPLLTVVTFLSEIKTQEPGLSKLQWINELSKKVNLIHRDQYSRLSSTDGWIFLNFPVCPHFSSVVVALLRGPQFGT